MTKYKSDGSGYVFSTYLGGQGVELNSCTFDDTVVGDSLSAVAVDESSNVYVTGATFDNGFPAVNSIQPYLGTTQLWNLQEIANTNTFVTEYKADGSACLFSTFLGGTGWGDVCGYAGLVQGDCGFPVMQQSASCNTSIGAGGGGTSISVDQAGSIYVAGVASSGDFPINNSIPGTAPGPGTFIAKLHSSGLLVYSSFFPGGIAAVTTDSRRNAWVTGATGSEFPATYGAFQTRLQGSTDAYVAKVTITGKPQSVIFHPPPLTYGKTTNLAGSAYSTSGLPVHFAIASGLALAKLKGTRITPPAFSEQVPTVLEAYQEGNGTYEGAVAFVSDWVRGSALIVAAQNESMTYGSAVPALTYAPITSTVGGAALDIIGSPKLSTTATSRSPIGAYPIQVSQGTLMAALSFAPTNAPLPDFDYYFTFKNASLTIRRAELTVAAGNYTIHQGQHIEPELKYTITGFVNGDSRSTAVRGNPELMTKARIDSPPGTYPIVVKPGSLTARNYKFKEVDGSITIVK